MKLHNLGTRIKSGIRKLVDLPRAIAQNTYINENILNMTHELLRTISQLRTLETSNEIFRILSDSRYQNPLRLEPYGHKCYSQHDEDGMIQEIFRRIGIKNHVFVEFGVGDGLENNSLFLLKQGWTGLWIEGSPENAEKIKTNFADSIKNGKLRFIESFITRENINNLIGSEVKGEIDMLSIDIDGNDYYVWEAIDVISPRLLVIEYNAKFLPPVKWSINYDPNHKWDFSDYQGASLAAMNELSIKKGYRLVGCNLNGTNAFFVRNDLTGDKFLQSDDIMEYYHPPRYYLFEGYLLMAGHRPDARCGRTWL